MLQNRHHSHRIVVFKVWARDPRSLLHSGPFQDHNKTKMLFAFFTLVLSQEYNGVFQRLHAEAVMILQMSFIMPNIKKIRQKK